VPFGSLPTRYEPEGAARGLAVVLPGSNHSPAAPLLEFARLALLQHGFVVRQVWWDATSVEEERHVWVERQLVEALAAEAATPGSAMVVGKSLGTLASAYAAERELDAVWLTPVLTDEACVAGIRANGARQLLVGGLTDGLWDSRVASQLVTSRCEVHEIPDADHCLWVAGDAVRTAEVHVEVTQRLEQFLATLNS
jgi:hypothetical protein